MLTKSGLLSAIVGAAMLAMPVSALARDHDFRGRPNVWHDNGWHNGWVNHEAKVNRWDANHGQWIAHHDRWEANRWHAQNAYPAVVPPRTVYWNPAPYQPGYYPPPVNPYNNYNSAWNYGQPLSYYGALPPSSYSPSQQVSWLMQRRQQAFAVLSRMRARHDRDASNRMLTQINNINARISAINHGTGYGQLGYAPTTAAPYAASPVGPAYNSYAGSYEPSYPGATTSPLFENLGSVVRPFLGLPY
jgi:hypothetical protein